MLQRYITQIIHSDQLDKSWVREIVVLLTLVTK